MRVNCKLITYFIFSAIIAMGLTAYGDSSGGKNASGSIKKEIKSVLSAEIIGDIKESYAASSPIIQCDDDVFAVLDLNFSEKTSFKLDIPTQLLHQGEHPLSGWNDKLAMFFNKDSKFVRFAYDASNEKMYGKNVKGTMTLTSIPKKIGEHLIGHLKATAQRETYGKGKKEINIDMQFDILARSDTFHLCE